MTEKEFLDVMDEILDTEEPVTMETVLDNLEEWDSLSYVMFQAQMFVKIGRKMEPSIVKGAVNVRDLYQLIK